MTRARRWWVVSYLWACGCAARVGTHGVKRQYARRPLPRGAVWVVRAGLVAVGAGLPAYYAGRALGWPGAVTNGIGIVTTLGFYVAAGVGIFGRERGEEIT